MRGTNRMYLLGRALPWIQMMDNRWGLMLPLVHHQCSRQSGVRTRASYSMRNQVFNRDSQGPSIHRGKARIYSGDGLPVFVQVQEERREGWRERLCVHTFVPVWLYLWGPHVLTRQKDEEHFAKPQRTMWRFGQDLISKQQNRLSKPMWLLRLMIHMSFFWGLVTFRQLKLLG